MKKKNYKNIAKNVIQNEIDGLKKLKSSIGKSFDLIIKTILGCKNGKVIVKIDPNHFRPTEVDTLLGDASKAKKILGWQSKTSFNDLVKKMVRSDWNKVKKLGF